MQQQAADYYASYMDEKEIDARGLAPLKSMLARIAAVSSVADLSRALGEEVRADVDALNATNFHTDRLFGVWVTVDLNDPARSVPYLLQGGLDIARSRSRARRGHLAWPTYQGVYGTSRPC